jgi:hypothetical protein
MNPARTRINEVERACADLARNGHPVTFTQVAAATGTARSTLYRNTALRAIVEHHKHAPDGPLNPITDEIATLRTAVNTLADQVRRHEQQLRSLRS